MKAYRILAFVLLTTCRPDSQAPPESSAGELGYRFDRIVHQITRGEAPSITREFLLAGLTLDPTFKRRFTNFSGDQEGRYLSAMSLVDTSLHTLELHGLVAAMIALQKPDGRFGADTLNFEARHMDTPQMALLWGNGRLLTGLLDYYSAFPDRTEALESARRLGDFLEGVTQACTRPEIVDRFKTLGALGFICFTQITEGMVKLYEATGMDKYKRIAEITYPLLPEFGNQHSHGFLNTLRGVVMLYEATGDPVHLAFAEDIFDKILASENYLITGGVPEFFGDFASEEGPRDEGCSEADFFLLCLQLWEATGNNKYLDQAEYLFMNHMLYNQFISGAFGHHIIRKDYGFVTSPYPAQSWWCCNYHGLQALYQARAVVVTRENDIRKVNLFYPAVWKDDTLAFTLTKIKDTRPKFQLVVDAVSDGAARLAVRNPYWSNATAIEINGAPAEVTEKTGYLLIDRKLKRGDRFVITLQPALRIVGPDRKEIPLPLLTAKPVTACMIYGPWLLSVDDVYQSLFMTELSQDNIIYVPGEASTTLTDNAVLPLTTFNPESYLTFQYLKEGTSQTFNVVLRPISEVSFQGPSNVRYWLNFVRAD